jgi:hypothetical protein
MNAVAELFRLVLSHWTGGDWRSREKLLQGFAKHYAHIREVVPKDRLLEWNPKDGWEPLCKHLGNPVPDEPFPYTNKGDDVSKGFVILSYIRIVMVVAPKIVVPVLGTAVAYGAWVFARSGRGFGFLRK